MKYVLVYGLLALKDPLCLGGAEADSVRRWRIAALVAAARPPAAG